jgi:hypothetical protein
VRGDLHTSGHFSPLEPLQGLLRGYLRQEDRLQVAHTSFPFPHMGTPQIGGTGFREIRRNALIHSSAWSNPTASLMWNDPLNTAPFEYWETKGS